MTDIDRYRPAMREALRAAAEAAEWGDVPIGAAVFRDGEVLAIAANERERSGDASAHAEILAIRRACERLGTWRLTGCGIAVTLEPCPMCAGAIVNARLAELVYGAPDPKAGAAGSLYNICQDPRLNHELEVVWGVEAESAAALLHDFFATRRDPGI